jgi:Na+/melibiose symporter-like transporter
VPNAILADLVVATERKTGVQRGAMYFAVRSLVSKFAQMAVALLFPMVSMIGTRDYLDPGRLGLRFTLVYAIGFLGIGFLFMLGYREKEISAVVCDKIEDGPRG